MRIRRRPVAARASRWQYMVASVPEAQKRSRSQAGLTLQISSASASEFSFTQAKFAPSAAWRTTASATSGRACPTSTEPQPMEKSRKAVTGRVLDLAPFAPGDDRAELGGEIEFAVGAGGKHLQRALCGLVHVRFGHGELLAIFIAPARPPGIS